MKIVESALGDGPSDSGCDGFAQISDKVGHGEDLRVLLLIRHLVTKRGVTHDEDDDDPWQTADVTVSDVNTTQVR